VVGILDNRNKIINEMIEAFETGRCPTCGVPLVQSLDALDWEGKCLACKRVYGGSRSLR